VSETPLAPVKEEVDRVVADVTGDVGDVGGTVGVGGAGGQAPAAAPTPAATAEPSTRSTEPRSADDGPATTRERRDTRRGARRPTGRANEGGDPTDRAAARIPRPQVDAPGRASTERAGAEEEGNALTRTVDKLVEVVPRIVWIALGVLLVAAIALGARTFVERRRARVLEGERELLLREVALLERTLLPEVPERLGALATSVAYRPCEGPAAGGDFYDAFELDGERVALLVGDVSGHGPDALECTNAIRTGVHACLEAGMSPRLALQSVGMRAYTGSSGRFATAIVAVHDPSTGTLTYATAGHPPPIVSGPWAHEPVTVASSLPMGLGFRTGQRETTVPVVRDSLAYLFTDGLLEARAGDDMIGRERLTELVDELGPDGSAAALLERVIAEADDASDDMAVLMLRVESGVEPLAARLETLELDGADLDRGAGEVFLEACELSAADAQVALEEARGTSDRTGGAVIEVTIDGEGARARVSPARVSEPPLAAR
jgi:hypothetical protein